VRPEVSTREGAAAGWVRRLSAALYRRPRLKLVLLLVGPLGWLVGIYLVSLATLLVYGFWQYNDFTSSVDRI
jgi:putative spermidine/putrescine transport system permease protein